jgi:hypothetical protein
MPRIANGTDWACMCRGCIPTESRCQRKKGGEAHLKASVTVCMNTATESVEEGIYRRYQEANRDRLTHEAKSAWSAVENGLKLLTARPLTFRSAQVAQPPGGAPLPPQPAAVLDLTGMHQGLSETLSRVLERQEMVLLLNDATRNMSIWARLCLEVTARASRDAQERDDAARTTTRPRLAAPPTTS